MAIWDQLLKKIIGPVVNDSIVELNKVKADDIQKAGLIAQVPLWALTPVGAPGAAGGVQRMFPKGVRYPILRDFSLMYPVLRSCVNYRKRQINSLAWDITPKNVSPTDDTKKKKEVENVKEFFQHPTGDKNSTMRTFIDQIIEDIIVLDSVAVYRRKNRGGGIYGYQPIDAATIELILYEDGTIPQPPAPAFIQKVRGQVTTKLTSDELIYRVMNPRTNTPYGLSNVETLVITITTALKLSAYNLNYFTEGNIPEGFVELPKDIASNPDQLKLWQEAWDAMMSGDPRGQRKIKFLPEGMKFTPLKKTDDMKFEQFEKWLMMVTCSVMEVTPQSIGMQSGVVKGAVEAEWQIGKERGLYPLASLLKEIFDSIIQEDLGHNDLEWVWTNLNPSNLQEEADVFSTLVKSGAVSVDEYRIGQGMTPIGLGAYIMTPTGPVLVKDFITQAPGATAVAVSQFKPNLTPVQNAPKPKVDQTSQPEGPTKKIEDVKEQLEEFTKNPSATDVVEELKRWKRAAANDLKLGREFRNFQSQLIDSRTQSLIKSGLKSISGKDALDQLFDPFIGQQNNIIGAMLDLYDEIGSLTDYDHPSAEKNEKSD